MSLSCCPVPCAMLFALACQPSPQRPAAAPRTVLGSAAAVARPPALGRGARCPRPGNRNREGRDSAPLCLYARAGHHIKKFVYIAFIFRGVPAEKHPPAFFPHKNFQTQNSTWVAALGWSHGGVVAAGDGSADPWQRGLTIGCPLCSPWPLRSGPESRRIILSGGGVGGASEVAVAPAGEVGQEKSDGVTHRFRCQHRLVPPP